MFSVPNWTIPFVDDQITAHLQSAIDNKTKPPGSLGKLESLAAQIGRIQLADNPQGKLVIQQPAMLVFAADHGIAKHGVSIAPSEVTQQMVANFLAGGAAINCICRQHEVSLTVIDAGMLAPLDIHRSDYFVQRLGSGTADISEQPAMTFTQVSQGLEFGAQAAQNSIDQGSNVLGFGEMGIGNTSSATALFCGLRGLPAEAIVGRGTGISDEQLARKTALIQQALDRTHAADNQEIPRPYYLLASLGGFEIVQMVGAMLATAQQGKVIVVDGFIASVAAFIACDIAPQARQFMVFAHIGAERSHQLVLNALNAEPLLSLGMRLGEGTGAALAIPLIRTAAAFFNDMATFESANVHV